MRAGGSGDSPNGSSNPSGKPVANPNEIREQAERVIGDPLFRHSKRYSNLLRYIVNRTLEGRHDELKERIIGIEVFGRAPDYDTSLDPTVRVAANEVRKRLVLYYAEAGHKREIRIDVPVRSYVADFHLAPSQHVPQADVSQEPLREEFLAPTKSRTIKHKYVAVPIVAVVVALAVWGIQRLLTPVPMIDRFWAPVLKGSGPILICIGSPPSEASSSAQSSVPNDFAKPGMPFFEFSQKRVNVSMTDVTTANAVATLLRLKGKDSVVRAAQGTNLSDLRANPSVLVGSFHNEWAVRLGADLHFRFEKESDIGLRWIEDKSNPNDKKWAVDLSAPYDQVHSDYALISRIQDPATGQWWIGVAGLTGLGTLAAHQMVIDPKAMTMLASSLPKDWEHKNLQVVLAVTMIQGSPGGSRVVTTYAW